MKTPISTKRAFSDALTLLMDDHERTKERKHEKRTHNWSRTRKASGNSAVSPFVFSSFRVFVINF